MVEVASRDHFVAAPKLIAIVDPSHRREDDTRCEPEFAVRTTPSASGYARPAGAVGG
jgi:hypothetical protein